MNNLSVLRQKIDDIDAQLIELLALRFELTKEVGEIKKHTQLPAVDSSREAAQMQRIAALAKQHGLDQVFAQRFLRMVIDEVVAHHQALGV